MLKKLDRTFRQFFPKRMKDFPDYLKIFTGLKGLEIGGPSPAFSKTGFLPIYKVISGLDGCNFSSNTVWEGSIEDGQTFRYDDKIGRQYIADATDLSQIDSGKYDFILSCHSLEHIANPIKALLEWKRVVKPGGYFLLILPHKDGTFDHKRPVTSLQHIIEDFKRNTGEDDSTHYNDAINLHDISRDAGIADHESLVSRTAKNFENRCVHHHIFNTPLALQLVDHVSFKILRASHFTPFHIVILAQKPTGESVNNQEILRSNNNLFTDRRFPSDRL